MQDERETKRKEEKRAKKELNNIKKVPKELGFRWPNMSH